jgi:hypothetical protein
MILEAHGLTLNESLGRGFEYRKGHECLCMLFFAVNHPTIWGFCHVDEKNNLSIMGSDSQERENSGNVEGKNEENIPPYTDPDKHGGSLSGVTLSQSVNNQSYIRARYTVKRTAMCLPLPKRMM